MMVGVKWQLLSNRVQLSGKKEVGARHRQEDASLWVAAHSATGREQMSATGRFLERAFTRRQVLATFAGVGMSRRHLWSLLHHAGDIATPRPAQYLVLIVLDGFRADYRTLAPMPALDALAGAGIEYQQAWVGQLESMTPTGHATLGRGVTPSRHGIIGFEWREPASGREILDGWDAEGSEILHDLRRSKTPSIARAVKLTGSASTVVAIASEKPYAAAAMGGPAADYILHHSLSPDAKSLVPTAAQGHAPPAAFSADPKLQLALPLQRFTDWDDLSGAVALAALEELRPRALLLNLPGADIYGHTMGGPANPAIMSTIVAGLDRNIGRVVSAYQSAGLYQDTLFVVVADHGMAMNLHTVAPATVGETVTAAGGKQLFHTGGTASYIYLQEPTAARAVAEKMLTVRNVTAAYFRKVSKARIHYAPALGAGLAPELDAAYRYLLASFAGPTSPDVVATFRENTIGQARAAAYGHHGGLSWGVQQVPLILSGPGVRSGTVSGFPARLMDVAPTALRLLGIPPQRMDGAVLADALSAPTAAESSAQAALWQPLSAHCAALAKQSQAEVADDQARGLHPPPLPPPAP
jgi:arylsulfatase A-like enzyme